MEGGDNGRTGWLRNDKSFNTNNVRNMKLLWKTKLDSVPREMHNLFPPMIATDVNTNRGTKEILIVAGVSDDLFALDAATGTLLWKKHFDNTWAPGGRGPSGDTLCPGGLTATPVIGANARRVHRLRSFLGWSSLAGKRGGRRRGGAAGKFIPPNGKPYASICRGEWFMQAPRSSAAVSGTWFSRLILRPGAPASSSQAAVVCGDAGESRSRRTAISTWARAMVNSTLKTAAWATGWWR
jgi:hypothetical protein